MGTIRTLSDGAAAQVEERIRQIARGLSEASGGDDRRHVPARDRGRGQRPRGHGGLRPGRRRGRRAGERRGDPLCPSMGGEDFSGYLKHAPGCLLRLGVASPDRPRHFLHSPHFDIDESALAIGAKVLAHSVVLLSGTRQEHAPS